MSAPSQGSQERQPVARERRDAQSGKRYLGSAYLKGHCYSLGTYPTQEQAAQAYQAELRRENPDLADAPSVVERGSGLTNGCNADGNETNARE